MNSNEGQSPRKHSLAPRATHAEKRDALTHQEATTLQAANVGIPGEPCADCGARECRCEGEAQP